MPKSPEEEIIALVALGRGVLNLIRESKLMQKKRGRKPGKSAKGVKADGSPKAKPGPKPKKAPQKAGNGGQQQHEHATPIE